MYKPNAREATLILLRAIEERGERRGSELTRARLSQVTLKRLWNRENLSNSWLAEVDDWLLSADWTLLRAGTTFGLREEERGRELAEGRVEAHTRCS